MRESANIFGIKREVKSIHSWQHAGLAGFVKINYPNWCAIVNHCSLVLMCVIENMHVDVILVLCVIYQWFFAGCRIRWPMLFYLAIVTYKQAINSCVYIYLSCVSCDWKEIAYTPNRPYIFVTYITCIFFLNIRFVSCPRRPFTTYVHRAILLDFHYTRHVVTMFCLIQRATYSISCVCYTSRTQRMYKVHFMRQPEFHKHVGVEPRFVNFPTYILP